jgi:hypothetical protein
MDPASLYLQFPFPQFLASQQQLQQPSLWNLPFMTTTATTAGATDPTTGFETLYTPSQVPTNLRKPPPSNNNRNPAATKKSLSSSSSSSPTPYVTASIPIPAPAGIPTFFATASSPSSSMTPPPTIPNIAGYGAVSPSLVPARLRMAQIPVTTYRPAIVIEATGEAPGTYHDPNTNGGVAVAPFLNPGMGMGMGMGAGMMLDPQQMAAAMMMMGSVGGAVSPTMMMAGAGGGGGGGGEDAKAKLKRRLAANQQQQQQQQQQKSGRRMSSNTRRF